MTAFDSASATRQGPRAHQADAVKVTGTMWAIADGVGSNLDAPEAAHLAVTTALESSDLGAVGAVAAARTALRAFYTDALFTYPDTTLLVASAIDERWGGGIEIGWVGDSRAYLYRDGILRRLTADHNLAQIETDFHREAGHRSGYMLLATVTSRGAIGQAYIPDSDGILLLCTDGLTGALTDGQIAAILREGADSTAAELADALIRAADDAGLVDNTALIIVRDKPTPQVQPEPEMLVPFAVANTLADGREDNGDLILVQSDLEEIEAGVLLQRVVVKTVDGTTYAARRRVSTTDGLTCDDDWDGAESADLTTVTFTAVVARTRTITDYVAVEPDLAPAQ